MRVTQIKLGGGGVLPRQGVGGVLPRQGLAEHPSGACRPRKAGDLVPGHTYVMPVRS